MTTKHDTTEQVEKIREDRTMEMEWVHQTAERLHEQARSGRLELEAIRRAEAGDEGDGTPAMIRTIRGFTYALETGGALWIVEEQGEGAPYHEPIKLPPQETARLFRFFMPIALEQLLDYGREHDQAREAEQAE